MMRQFVLIGRSNHARATVVLARLMREDMQKTEDRTASFA
jgi:hypothetical protein